jgi:gliding motility-associated-like protein
MRSFALFLGAALYTCIASAQTCDNPISLCGNEAETLSEFSTIDFTGLAIDTCITGNLLSVARFHTSFYETDEGVTVSLSNFDCPGTTAQVLVVQANTLDFCNTTLYSAVSPCISTSSDVTFDTGDLYINTDYLVLVSLQTSVVPTLCDMQIEVFGEPLSIQACCPTNIDYLQSANLEVLGGNLGVGYNWTPSMYVDSPTSYSVTVTPPTTTLFEVSGFVENCQYSDQVLVVVGTEIDVPNAFSPNGDNINDLWKITGLSAYTRSQLTLYDRWGQEVFRSIAYPQPWDGVSSGRSVPVGTYYYVIELNQPGVDLEPITGSVAVIR